MVENTSHKIKHHTEKDLSLKHYVSLVNIYDQWLKEKHMETTSFCIWEWWSLTTFYWSKILQSKVSITHQGYIYKMWNFRGYHCYDIPKFASTLISERWVEDRESTLSASAKEFQIIRWIKFFLCNKFWKQKLLKAIWPEFISQNCIPL